MVDSAQNITTPPQIFRLSAIPDNNYESTPDGSKFLDFPSFYAKKVKFENFSLWKNRICYGMIQMSNVLVNKVKKPRPVWKLGKLENWDKDEKCKAYNLLLIFQPITGQHTLSFLLYVPYV